MTPSGDRRSLHTPAPHRLPPGARWGGSVRSVAANRRQLHTPSHRGRRQSGGRGGQPKQASERPPFFGVFLFNFVLSFFFCLRHCFLKQTAPPLHLRLLFFLPHFLPFKERLFQVSAAQSAGKRDRKNSVDLTDERDCILRPGAVDEYSTDSAITEKHLY